MNTLSLIALALAATVATTRAETLRLTKDNFVTFRGPVTGSSASKFVNELMSKRNNSELFVYLATPGGSVTAGLEIAQTLQALSDEGVNVTCVADVALSMGFVLTQFCPGQRVVMPQSIMMQHQIAFGLEGPIHNVRSYLNSIVEWDEDLDQQQADRIGLTLQQFQDRVHDDWWLFGKRALTYGVADKMANVYCDFAPGVEKLTINTMFGPVHLAFSTCPVARDPLSISFGFEDERVPGNSTSTNSTMSYDELLQIVRGYFYGSAVTALMRNH